MLTVDRRGVTLKLKKQSTLFSKTYCSYCLPNICVNVLYNIFDHLSCRFMFFLLRLISLRHVSCQIVCGLQPSVTNPLLSHLGHCSANQMTVGTMTCCVYYGCSWWLFFFLLIGSVFSWSVDCLVHEMSEKFPSQLLVLAETQRKWIYYHIRQRKTSCNW